MKVKIGILVVLACGLAYGQGARILELRGGYFDPEGTPSGLIFGGSYGISFDDRVSFSLGVDYFHRGYTEQMEIAEEVVDDVVVSTKMETVDQSTTLLPISATGVIRFPFNPPLLFYLGGGVAYEFLFTKNINFHGFGWQACAGIEYNLGLRSSFILEAFYNSCHVKGNKEKREGHPVWDEVDVTGLGFRGGLRLEFF